MNVFQIVQSHSIELCGQYRSLNILNLQVSTKMIDFSQNFDRDQIFIYFCISKKIFLDFFTYQKSQRIVWYSFLQVSLIEDTNFE